MSTNIERLSFPLKVFRGKGALDSLGAFCRTLGGNALVLGGKTALGKTQDRIHLSLQQAGVQVAATEWYGGESSRKNINALIEKVHSVKADVLIAVGGGKAIDTGKLVADKCSLPLVTIPTIAATCSAITPVSVVYTDEGEFVEMVTFDECPAATVMDTEVILQAPLRWLAAGMGDTLAKWYEYRVSIKCTQQNSLTLAALSSGKLCFDLIERFGSDARKALDSGVWNEALDSVVDAIILHAGLASIFGGEKIRSAAAHGFHNGLTKIPAAHKAGHGSIVGYGNLFLLALEDRPDEEILEAARLAEQCGVPTTLKQIVELSDAELRIVAQATLLTPDVKNMPFSITEEMILKAIERVERLVQGAKLH